MKASCRLRGGGEDTDSALVSPEDRGTVLALVLILVLILVLVLMPVAGSGLGSVKTLLAALESESGELIEENHEPAE